MTVPEVPAPYEPATPFLPAIAFRRALEASGSAHALARYDGVVVWRNAKFRRLLAAHPHPEVVTGEAGRAVATAVSAALGPDRVRDGGPPVLFESPTGFAVHLVAHPITADLAVVTAAESEVSRHIVDALERRLRRATRLSALALHALHGGRGVPVRALSAACAESDVPSGMIVDVDTRRVSCLAAQGTTPGMDAGAVVTGDAARVLRRMTSGPALKMVSTDGERHSGAPSLLRSFAARAACMVTRRRGDGTSLLLGLMRVEQTPFGPSDASFAADCATVVQLATN